MGLGRGRWAALACALGALALLGTGCGAQNHANGPRPPAPTRVSVSITRNAVTVLPAAIGVGSDPTQQVPQNKGTPQPDIPGKASLNVVFVVANLTDFDSSLQIRGPKDAGSGAMVANGNGIYQLDLPTGLYTIGAADIPSAKPARLVVGPYRASSQNDVLLP
jgi:hypothetical protein